MFQVNYKPSSLGIAIRSKKTARIEKHKSVRSEDQMADETFHHVNTISRQIVYFERLQKTKCNYIKHDNLLRWRS